MPLSERQVQQLLAEWKSSNYSQFNDWIQCARAHMHCTYEPSSYSNPIYM